MRCARRPRNRRSIGCNYSISSADSRHRFPHVLTAEGPAGRDAVAGLPQGLAESMVIAARLAEPQDYEIDSVVSCWEKMAERAERGAARNEMRQTYPQELLKYFIFGQRAGGK